MVSHQRVADSLAVRSAQARARNQAAEMSLLDAARSVEEASARRHSKPAGGAGDPGAEQRCGGDPAARGAGRPLGLER